MPTATKSARRTTSAAPPAAANGQAHETLPADQSTAQTEGAGVWIDVKLIDESPLNPRQVWDGTELDNLADSLKRHGQQQNCTVRPKPGGRYEIIGGARRYRATKLARLPKLLCRVLDVTDEEAVELRGIENYRRQQLNPLEEAIWFRQMIDVAGYTQKALEQRLGVSQGQISHRLGLLELPEAWQAKIMSGDIPATHARTLRPWLPYPAVLDKIEKLLGEASEPPSAQEFQSWVQQAVMSASRCAVQGYGGAEFKITSKLKEELQIIELPRPWGGTERRAMNVKLFDQHQKAARKRKKEREAKQRQEEAADGTAGGVKGKHKPAKPAEPETPDLNKLADYWDQWWVATLAERIEGKLTKEQQVAVNRLALVALNSDYGIDEGIGDLVEMATGERHYSTDGLAPALLKMDAKAFATVNRTLCVKALRWQIDSAGYTNDFLSTEDVEAVATATFGIDVEKEWKPEYDWLDLLSEEQLRGLVPSIDPHINFELRDTLGKRDLIEYCLQRWPAGYVPLLLARPKD